MRRHIPLQLRVHAHVGCMMFASTRLITLQNLKIVFHETALFLLMIVSDLNSSNWCTRVHISFIWTLCVATRCALVKGRGNSIWGRAHRHFCWEGKWLGSSLRVVGVCRQGYATYVANCQLAAHALGAAACGYFFSCTIMFIVATMFVNFYVYIYSLLAFKRCNCVVLTVHPCNVAMYIHVCERDIKSFPSRF